MLSNLQWVNLMSNTFLVLGPPGTGKTTYIKNQVEKRLTKYDGSDIMLTSYTRAAAVELAGREMSLPKQNIGTLHAFCFNALGGPDLAELHLKDWNRDYPEFKLGGGKASDVDD